MDSSVFLHNQEHTECLTSYTSSLNEYCWEEHYIFQSTQWLSLVLDDVR
jgi:hypothetical protein